jgi:transcriptional regulator with PAS, ATPase and Fis domain
LYKVLWDMKQDINDLKRTIIEMSKKGDTKQLQDSEPVLVKKFYHDISNEVKEYDDSVLTDEDYEQLAEEPGNGHMAIEESLSIHEKEIDLIKKALARHNGKRKIAAKDLGISERTLYRKIKEYNIN